MPAVPKANRVNVERERLKNIAWNKAAQMAQAQNKNTAAASVLALTKATIERRAQSQGQSVAEYLGKTSLQEIAKNIERYAESAADVDTITELTLSRTQEIFQARGKNNPGKYFEKFLQLKRQKEFQNKSIAQLAAYILGQENPETAKVAGLALQDDLLKKTEKKDKTPAEPENGLLDPQVQIRNSGSWLKINLVSVAELAAQKKEKPEERLANLYIKPAQDPLLSAEFVAERLKIRQRA
jgi:hypothetical protein